MKLDYVFRQRCEKIAEEQRKNVFLQPYQPLPGDILAKSHQVEILEPAQMPGVSPDHVALLAGRSDWDGLLLRHLPHRSPIILLRSGLPSTRRESTIMHELAHLLLDHTPIQWNSEIGAFSDRNLMDENEAAYLGGCLQVPRSAIVWASQVGLNIARTAACFGASEQMVVYRANVTGVRFGTRAK